MKHWLVGSSRDNGLWKSLKRRRSSVACLGSWGPGLLNSSSDDSLSNCASLERQPSVAEPVTAHWQAIAVRHALARRVRCPVLVTHGALCGVDAWARKKGFLVGKRLTR